MSGTWDHESTKIAPKKRTCSKRKALQTMTNSHFLLIEFFQRGFYMKLRYLKDSYAAVHSVDTVIS